MANQIEFSGYNWLIKQSQTKVGPGPNRYSYKGISLINGELKLEIIQQDGNTYCSELFLDKSLGYGKYVFQLSSRIDLLQDRLVLGLFTWDDNYHPNNCEIDIEFSRWGDPQRKNSQYVVPTSANKGNANCFETELYGDYTTHIIEWRPENIHFQSIHGHVGLSKDYHSIIQSWVYSGREIPHPADERVHINLWKTHDKSVGNRNNGITYAIINRFMFEPF